MTKDQIRNRIDELCTLFTFLYHGKEGHVDPFSHTNYLLWFEGEEKTVNSIDEVMNTPFFDGHTLAEISEEIEITDY